ncbi:MULTISPECIES: GyrI-like domain-containing protein [Anaerostipes]|uniref:GyrI-like domain-containing protein n=1 Tax=Anaerostipes hominis (ex Lee et al. 2021) TaxID=2025494 RepID=A0ABV4DL72_9FIRM|nr:MULTISPECIES: GyrI-like domain-containing protein [Anaerostipes]
MTIDKGLCVQIMHIGSYDTEPETVAVLDAFLGENGYANDMADGRLLFIRPEKEAPEKMKTVIRHPIK